MRLPILLYHDIRGDSFNIKTVKPELRPYILRESDFRKQIEWLAENGHKNVALVFDDGWKSNYEIVYPLLKQYGFTATFFVTIENIGKREMMTWEQLKEMANNGMIIGSHNMTHRAPVELSDEELRYELRESKRILEDNLGRNINSFSSPTGFYDKRIIDIAREVGYKQVYFTRAAWSEIGAGTVPNFANGEQKQNWDSPLLILNKIGIKRDCSLETFKAIVHGDERILAKLRSKQIVRDWAKSVLGVKFYERAKDIVLR